MFAWLCRVYSLVMGTSCKVELQPECDSSAYFDGAIDDLAFFAGALTDAEVRLPPNLTVN